MFYVFFLFFSVKIYTENTNKYKKTFKTQQNTNKYKKTQQNTYKKHTKTYKTHIKHKNTTKHI